MSQPTQSKLFREACLVNGKWVQAADGATSAVHNPADGSLVGHVPSLSAKEIEDVIAAAASAQKVWAAKAASERAAVLERWNALILQHADEIAAILTAEQGKPLAEAKGEVLYAASFIKWFAEEAKRVYGDVIPAPTADKRMIVIKQPVGVCAAITPWNFPAAMITRKAGPALATGCAMIVRPASQTPFTALALGELAVQAGVPAGILQVVTGKSGVVGGVLTKSDTVRKLSFTGSTEVGRTLMAQCAPTIKRISLELGGNAPFIVFDDADLDAAVVGAIASKYRNAGQTCVCANRLYVQSGVYDEFAKRLAEAVAKMPVGRGTEPGVLIGPMIDGKAVEKVESHIQDAVAKGAKVLLGGKRHSLGGQYFEPTILTGVTKEMRVAREETFGPLAPLFKFDTEEEAVAQANDTEYGLAAYFYTESARRAWRVSEALEYGLIGHNTGLISCEVAPFGGMKQSGIGREGSKYGTDEYVEIKYVCSYVG
ncbi:succinic semialdehyde dehydrogenase [Desulfovibrio sp. X2]|uniref:NAD-dependent succinate-semialdehyde dehydrogenase n=1 Tax=Desulfovibrio sp. X2 TaxID=941449 RepID=UPI000358D3CF|nr:NAD-dependent succinate-semialdehyde dehydrogenase [Desulfovibrio sp. X2]EPR40380.1 succinic semialdehyde dehydrogenase [Desulfovibrio sp. X2]